jgi:uncharacterized protein (DUF885 family)
MKLGFTSTAFIAVLSMSLFSSCKQENGIANTDETKQLNTFLDSVFDLDVSRSPQYETQLGIKKDYDKWNDLSDEKAQEDISFTKKYLAEIKRRFHPENLDRQGKISYELFINECEKNIANFPFRFHNYPVNQMDGMHSSIPSFLINMHNVSSKSDAEAYIARLHGIEKLFGQLFVQLQTREKMGIIPPKFVFPMVKDDCKNILTGKPFDNSKTNSPLLADICSKIDSIKDISSDEKFLLKSQAEKELLETVKPAYEKLLAYWDELAKKATNDDGAWKFPKGNDFYAMALKNTTTTAYTPDEIFNIGEKEVARIQAEMKVIMDKVGFKGSLQDFFKYLREDKKFYYPSTEAGKAAYVKDANTIIDNMRNKLDDLFITKPKAPLVVKPVEPFREKSAGGAFYEEPALDGSRPGRYYINLYTLQDQPNYQMEALAYHEAIPGHHMQIAIAQELKNLPKFRTLNGNTAYVEGWALYSELVPKEIGFYTDPYSDFGRLSMEIFRASRLVIDVGLHYKKWSKEKAYQYMIDNTPNPANDSRKEIERYVVWPSQATGYKIGMIKIYELREKAKKAMGAKFNIREFHDVVLANGAVPMDMLEKLVDEYIASKK